MEFGKFEIAGVLIMTAPDQDRTRLRPPYLLRYRRPRVVIRGISVQGHRRGGVRPAPGERRAVACQRIADVT